MSSKDQNNCIKLFNVCCKRFAILYFPPQESKLNSINETMFGNYPHIKINE
jgi:hypothetical protein